MSLALLSPLLLLAPLQGITQAPAQTSAARQRLAPNLVLILADDFGVDMVGAYGEGTAPPCTPNIDGLASQGMLFRNAWANPICSPTRAAVLTGRYGFRTGIGQVVMPSSPGLFLSELTLPEVLSGYSSTFAGKWHLAGNLGNSHPNDSGFEHFAGIIRGAVPSYFQWQKVVDGQPSQSNTYATTDNADEAVLAINVMQEPWLLVASFVAPHSPYHEPPASLCPSPTCPSTWCGSLPANPTNRDLAKAMTEALDAEIGRLLTALDAVDPNAFVFFMGDNGTDRMVSEAPFLPGHAKNTLYEGGVNVPLLVRGPGVALGECAALVSCTDLFATFTELAGEPVATEDSVSMVPYFTNPALSLRATVYTEAFSPNHASIPFQEHRRAIRGERYKLIRETGQADELYDLLVDPFETANLLPSLTAGEQTAYDALVAELVALGVD